MIPIINKLNSRSKLLYWNHIFASIYILVKNCFSILVFKDNKTCFLNLFSVYRQPSLPLPRSSFLSLFTSMDTVRIRLCPDTPSSACPTLRSSTLLERVFRMTRKWTYLAMSLNAGRFTVCSVVYLRNPYNFL